MNKCSNGIGLHDYSWKYQKNYGIEWVFIRVCVSWWPNTFIHILSLVSICFGVFSVSRCRRQNKTRTIQGMWQSEKRQLKSLFTKRKTSAWRCSFFLFVYPPVRSFVRMPIRLFVLWFPFCSLFLCLPFFNFTVPNILFLFHLLHTSISFLSIPLSVQFSVLFHIYIRIL